MAINAASTFTQSAFELRWQLRILGQPFPATKCPWCDPVSPLTKEHLQDNGGTFAYHFWFRGVLPAEAFMYPPQPDWFAAALGTIHALVSACHSDQDIATGRGKIGPTLATRAPVGQQTTLAYYSGLEWRGPTPVAQGAHLCSPLSYAPGRA